MEINLEKIELVKDRTGVTYKEAKEALEKANGSVVDAIIDLEEAAGIPTDEEYVRSFVDSDIVSKVKETIAKGNVSRILVKREGETILNLPLSAGVLGAFIAPWGVIVGAIAAAGMNCKIEFVNEKGDVVDLNGKVKSGYDKVKDMSEERFGKVKDGSLYSEVKEKIDNLDLKEKIENFDLKESIENFDINKTIDNIKEKLGEIIPEEKEGPAPEPQYDVSAKEDAPAAEAEEEKEDILIFE